MRYEESMKIALVFVIPLVCFVHPPRVKHDSNDHDDPYIFLKIIKQKHSQCKSYKASANQ